jgi:uncharacterized membrane protein YbjE (DUF340 family)
LGISLAFLDNLASNLLAILHYAAVSVVIILLCNIAALMWLSRKCLAKSSSSGKITSRLAMALESLQLCGVVLIGFLIGLSGSLFTTRHRGQRIYADLPLFLIGIQLRNNGMTLRQIVLNRRGMIVAVVAWQFIAGRRHQRLYSRPAAKNRSGHGLRFGWYSLSGILLTESYGPVIGSAAFFNDLARELLAIMLIPGWCAAAVPRRWAFAARHQWTLRCRYCNALAAWRLSRRPSCMASF